MHMTVATSGAIGYVHLREGAVARTVQVTAGLLVDLDGYDRILGIETLSGEDWREALVNLAMTGRLAVPDRQVVTVGWPCGTPGEANTELGMTTG